MKKKPHYPLHVMESTGNAKLGPIAATYRPVGPTCPPCGAAEICYAKRGHVGIWQRRSKLKQDSFGKLNGAPFVRHEVSGDSFKTTANGKQILDRSYVTDKINYHRSNPWCSGFGYTHRAESWDSAGLGPQTWPENFVTLASCETLEDAKKYQSTGWRTARIIQTPQDVAPNESLCPVDVAKYNRKEASTNCAKCRKCFAGGSDNIAFVQLGNKRDK